MGTTGLSIENRKFVFSHFFKYTLIFFVCIAGFLFPGSSYAWFSEDSGETMPLLNQPISPDMRFSGTYVLLYNEDAQKKNLFLFPDFKSQHFLTVDRVNIDIPLDVLSKNAIDPGESIDRLLAVNLRIKKILDEYAKLDKRAEMLLKDIKNPYFDSVNKKNQNIFASSNRKMSVSAGKKKLRKDLTNIIKNSQSYTMNITKNNQKTLTSLTRLTKMRQSFNPTTLTQPTGQSPEFDSLQEQSEVSQRRHIDNELPWIFNFILKGIKYCIDHKVEMTLYALLVIFFISLISLKGRQ